MATWTDRDGNVHVITADGAHFVARGENYVRLPS